MERRKALFASAVAAVTLTLGSVAFVAGSGLLAGATDNVGNLQPTSAPTTVTAPREITVFVDPVTGTATTVAPQTAATAARSEPSAGAAQESGHDDKNKDDESDD